MVNESKYDLPPMEKIMIYLAKSGDHYKIGYSGSVEARLREIQVGNPLPVELVDSWQGDKSDESAIHQYLQDKRVRGEWFDLSDDDLAWLETTKPAHSSTRSFTGRAKLKVGGCSLCARDVYYFGVPDTVTCIACDWDFNINMWNNKTKNAYRVVLRSLDNSANTV